MRGSAGGLEKLSAGVSGLVKKRLDCTVYSIRCMLLLTFKSLAAIYSEKSTVFTFSYRKPKLPNLTLP